MDQIQKAQRFLDLIKNDVIGLFKMKNSKRFELVTRINEKNTLDTISISQFGAISKSFCLPYQHYGHLELFPDGKNMNQMLDEPFEFDAFIKKFNLL